MSTATKGLSFVPFFLTPGIDPYASVLWEQRTAHVGDYHQEGVWFPQSWSQRATDITASKYFRMIDGERENDLRDMINRVVSTLTVWGGQDGYFCKAGDDAQRFRNELRYILVNQIASFNSPVWFNIGVPGVPQQSSACFLVDVEDTMPSILNWYTEEGMIFKSGSGSGCNVSKIRAKNAPLSNGGTASGPLSFMRVSDKSAGAMKSGGGTRRSAAMRVMNCDHPDILEFIWCKVREEEKSRALRAAGYEGNAIEEAQVDFQNANHSVCVSDEFMEATTLHAAVLFNQIAEAAHACGDPGLMFDGTVNRWNTTPVRGKIVSPNPCSEVWQQPNTACNLASINLIRFLKDDNTFDIPAFRHTVDILITAQDILCGRSDYPTEKIKQNSLDFRPLGLGYTNLGATLMAQGMPYDSDEGRDFAGKVTSLMTAEAYLQSARMAEQLGPFAGYDANREEVLNVLTMHHAANNWFDAGRVWAEATALAKQHGIRNAQVTLLAPTGTISFMMDAETTGIEPLIGLTQNKKLVGGGTLEMMSHVAAKAVVKLGVDAYKMESDPVFQTALGSNPLPWQAHVKMVAAVQPFLSGGVSKTINMPADATIEDVKSAYLLAWDLGLKSIAIYRDGSKTVQPVCVAPREGQPHKTESLNVEVRPPTARRRLADERPAITHKFSIDGYEGYVTPGMFEDGTLGEIFIRMSKEGSTLGGLMDAFATAVSLGLQYGVPLEALVEKFTQTKFEPMGMTNNPDIPIAQSIVDYIFRWLGKKFLGESAVVERNMTEVRSVHVAKKTNGHAPPCPECGDLMVPTGTCFTCTTCGTSGGCA